MKRYTLFLLIVMGSAASAVAAIAPSRQADVEFKSGNVTVIEKNQAFPLAGPLVVEECLNTDCTLTRS